MTSKDLNPADHEWNHSYYEEGVMELVPSWQHKRGSIFQSAIHAGKGFEGGWGKWGKMK